MRCNQVTLSVERFGKYVPKNYPASVQRINVYCDDYDSIYAALSKAYALAINELAEYEDVGVRTDVYTNEFSESRPNSMSNTLPHFKRKYEEDVNLEYYRSNLELCQDRVWVYEHVSEILEVLQECTSSEMMVVKLKDRFGLDDFQIRKLEQMRFDMMTHKEYLDAKQKIKECEDHINAQYESKEYQKIRKEETEYQINNLKAYFRVIENCDEILKLSLTQNNKWEFERILEEQFGFTREQAEKFKYFNLGDFSKSEQEKKKTELQHLEQRLEFYNEKELIRGLD